MVGEERAWMRHEGGQGKSSLPLPDEVVRTSYGYKSHLRAYNAGQRHRDIRIGHDVGDVEESCRLSGTCCGWDAKPARLTHRIRILS